MKAPERTATEVVSGAYRVVSSVLKYQTEQRLELHNLTDSVREFVKSSGVRAGSVSVSSLHTTCAIFMNEWQDALLHDVKAYLESLVTKDGYYRHNDPAWSDCDRHNADSHLRALVLGMSMTLPVADGQLVLGEWQSIMLGELDGPRERSVRFQVMGVATE